MKKIIGAVMLLVILSVFVVPSLAAEKSIVEANDDITLPLVDTPHTYIVLPGSAEWNEMTPAERLASCAVTQQEVEGMTTEALLTTVLNYPYLIDMLAYDSLDVGITAVSSYFPGLPELLSRADAAETLVQYLETTNSVLSENNFDIKVYCAQKLVNVVGVSEDRANVAVTPRYTQETVDTPVGTPVDVWRGMTWEDHNETAENAMWASESYAVVYPSADMVEDPDPEYNCHSYAWYSRFTNNPYWMNNPSAYMTDGSYEESTSRYGNRITYTDGLGRLTHSGVVVSSDGTIMSKWAEYAVFTHDPDDCPYAKVGYSVKYWTAS